LRQCKIGNTLYQILLRLTVIKTAERFPKLYYRTRAEQVSTLPLNYIAQLEGTQRMQTSTNTKNANPYQC